MTFSARVQSGGDSASNIQRMILISQAFAAKFDLWKGNGIGSYNFVATGVDELYYPHNLFIETILETGLIGLIILLLSLKIVFPQKSHFLLICFIYFFINSMFSGDISGNNYLFTFIAICIFYRNNSRINNSNNILIHSGSEHKSYCI